MDKIILVHYLNLSKQSTARIAEVLVSYSKMLERYYNNANIIHFVLSSDESKIDCVNPKLVSSDEYQSALTKLEEFKAKQEEFFKNKSIGSED